MQLEAPQPVLFFEILPVVQRGLADIDRHDLRGAVSDRESCCLVGAATCDENVDVGFEFPVGPQDPVKIGRVVPMLDAVADCFEVLDREWVSPPLVLTGNNIGARIATHRGIMGYGHHRLQQN
jgi:hypothetical protein